MKLMTLTYGKFFDNYVTVVMGYATVVMARYVIFMYTVNGK